MRTMAFKWIAAAILLAGFAMLATSCVSIPVPPSDMGGAKRGELGNLNIRVVCEYKPNWQGTMNAALRRLSGDNKEVKAPIK